MSMGDERDQAEQFDEDVVVDEEEHDDVQSAFEREPDAESGRAPEIEPDPALDELDRAAALEEVERQAHHPDDHPGLDAETLELAQEAGFDDVRPDEEVMDAIDARGGPELADHDVDVDQLSDDPARD